MRDWWYRVWYQPIDCRQYAMLRIAIGYLAAVYLVQLLPFAQDHFSPLGWLGSLRLEEVVNWGSWSLFNLHVGRFATVYSYAIFGVGIVAAIAMMIGWYTRMAIFVTWLVLVSLWNRNPLLLDGDDAVLKVMCFYLMFCPAGSRWSFDARYDLNTVTLLPIGALRLIQFQVALLYFVSGWVKFHSTEWLDGRILSYVLSHPHYARFNLSTGIDFATWADALAFISTFIRWWELLFPLLLLQVHLRRLSLVIGLLFHLGLFLSMNLRWFPLVMIVLYPALLSRVEFEALMRFGIQAYRGLTMVFKASRI